MKNTTLITFVLVTIFLTSSVFGQGTNAKDATEAARQLSNTLTTQAIEVQLSATKARNAAKGNLSRATKALKKAEAHVEALKKTQTEIADANTAADKALDTWEEAAKQLAKAVVPGAATTPKTIMSGLEKNERETRAKKVSAEAKLKALIVTAHETFEESFKELAKASATAYEPLGDTPADVDAALQGFLATADTDVNTKTTKSNTAKNAFDDAVAALRVANADFLAASAVQSRYKALSKPPSSKPTAAAKSYKLPKAVVDNLAATSTAMTKIATALETLNLKAERSAKAAEAIGPAITANTTATRQSALATVQVAAAVNANTARILSKEQLLQAQAYELARSVLARLSKVDADAATRFSHLTTIVVLKNPDLASKVKLLKTIEKRLEQGASRNQLKEIIELLERFAPKPVSQK